jgi:hypothetical protein
MKRLMAAALLAATFSVAVWAQPTTTSDTAKTALSPVADYARFPEYQTPALSPNGEHLAVYELGVG